MQICILPIKTSVCKFRCILSIRTYIALSISSVVVYLAVLCILEAQSTFVTSEATDQDASSQSQRCSLNDGDVVCNADLYVFNHEVDNG